MSSMHELHNIGFYGSTIELEHEAGLDLVGVRIWAEHLHIHGIFIVHGFDDLELGSHTFTLPHEWRWKYRSSASAGSPNSHLIGFITRSHLALRLSFPVTQARRAFARLICVTLAMLNDSSAISAAVSKLACRYKVALSPEFVRQVLLALRHQAVWVIHDMAR